MNDQALASIREYLEALEELMAKHRRMPAGAVSPNRFLLDNGQAFRVGSNTYKGRRGTPKQCFMNASRAALKPGTDLLYAEGYTTSVAYIPIPHAWLVSPAGEVIDPTLKGGDEKYGERGYFGLTFTKEYLARSLAKTGYFGLMHTGGLFDAPALHDIALGNTRDMLVDINALNGGQE